MIASELPFLFFGPHFNTHLCCCSPLDLLMRHTKSSCEPSNISMITTMSNNTNSGNMHICNCKNTAHHCSNRHKPKSVNALMTDWSPIQDSVFGRFGALRLHRTQPFVVGDSVWRCWILSFFCSELGPHVRRTCVLLSVGRSTSNTVHTNIRTLTFKKNLKIILR